MRLQIRYSIIASYKKKWIFSDIWRRKLLENPKKKCQNLSLQKNLFYFLPFFKNSKLWTKNFHKFLKYLIFKKLWTPFLDIFGHQKFNNFGAPKKVEKEIYKIQKFCKFSDFFDFQKCNFLHFFDFLKSAVFWHPFWQIFTLLPWVF